MAAFQSSQVSVSTSATEILSGLPAGRYQIKLLNFGTTSDVYLGPDSSVTVGSGFPLAHIPASGVPTVLTLDVVAGPDDALYGISDSTTDDIYVMVSPR